LHALLACRGSEDMGAEQSADAPPTEGAAAADSGAPAAENAATGSTAEVVAPTAEAAANAADPARADQGRNRPTSPKYDTVEAFAGRWTHEDKQQDGQDAHCKIVSTIRDGKIFWHGGQVSDLALVDAGVSTVLEGKTLLAHRDLAGRLQWDYGSVWAKRMPDLHKDPEGWFRHFDLHDAGLNKSEVAEALVQTFRGTDRAAITDMVHQYWDAFDADNSGIIEMSEFFEKDGLRDTILAKLDVAGVTTAGLVARARSSSGHLQSPPQSPEKHASEQKNRVPGSKSEDTEASKLGAGRKDAIKKPPELQSDSSEDEDGEEGDSPSRMMPVAELGPDGLPSVGSEGHAQGECKRCCFFPKGRCNNGHDCRFCHFDHDKTRRVKKKKKRGNASETPTPSSGVGSLSMGLSPACGSLCGPGTMVGGTWLSTPSGTPMGRSGGTLPMTPMTPTAPPLAPPSLTGLSPSSAPPPPPSLAAPQVPDRENQQPLLDLSQLLHNSNYPPPPPATCPAALAPRGDMLATPAPMRPAFTPIGVPVMPPAPPTPSGSKVPPPPPEGAATAPAVSDVPPPPEGTASAPDVPDGKKERKKPQSLDDEEIPMWPPKEGLIAQPLPPTPQGAPVPSQWPMSYWSPVYGSHPGAAVQVAQQQWAQSPYGQLAVQQHLAAYGGLLPGMDAPSTPMGYPGTPLGGAFPSTPAAAAAPPTPAASTAGAASTSGPAVVVPPPQLPTAVAPQMPAILGVPPPVPGTPVAPGSGLTVASPITPAGASKGLDKDSPRSVVLTLCGAWGALKAPKSMTGTEGADEDGEDDGAVRISASELLRFRKAVGKECPQVMRSLKAFSLQ